MTAWRRDYRLWKRKSEGFRVTAVDTVHGDSARRGVAARLFEVEVNSTRGWRALAFGDAARDAGDFCPTK